MRLNRISFKFIPFLVMIMGLFLSPLIGQAATHKPASPPPKSPHNRVDDLLETYKKNRVGNHQDAKTNDHFQIHKSASPKRIVFHQSNTHKPAPPRAKGTGGGGY